MSGDDTVLLTPGRMSQRQVKERDKEKDKEAGLQTPNREHITTPSALSPGVSYSHGKIVLLDFCHGYVGFKALMALKTTCRGFLIV